MKFITYSCFFLFLSIINANAKIVEKNQVFDDWLVSCKFSTENEENGDCFLGTQYDDDEGGGAIIFTKYYLAFAHNELLLSDGVTFKVDSYDTVESSMNTGISAFFKNLDRKSLSKQMVKGKSVLIDIKNQFKTEVSLTGFGRAYDYYMSKVK